MSHASAGDLRRFHPRHPTPRGRVFAIMLNPTERLTSRGLGWWPAILKTSSVTICTMGVAELLPPVDSLKAYSRTQFRSRTAACKFWRAISRSAALGVLGSAIPIEGHTPPLLGVPSVIMVRTSSTDK